ncbi:HDIG domain-containing metalloprotein [Enterococcus lemanii]|uniref:HD family phosphohydrolase n=1 Tax=Enterococcus lemanii TaxID=1159752 RepID=A0ABV9MWI4_9ENTE|nr:putative nucleotidyltransferase with HDIG domain [Enterococcus lemanii]
MVIQPLAKINQKLGKFFIAGILMAFFIFSSLLLFSNVQQRTIDYKEGQVAEQSIRANKTIENTTATEQKRKLAAEAVSPEYTFQEDLAKKQEQLISNLFSYIREVRKEASKENEERAKTTKEGNNPELVSIDEQIASLKKKLENVDTDDLSFYQKIPNMFYQIVFSLSDTELQQVETESLRLVKEQMNNQIRSSGVNEARQNAYSEAELLGLTNNQTQAIRYVLNQGIIANSYLNEKRTEELRKQAKEAVQPVMIFQGEVIVREGSQIDTTMIDKLNLLGMTSQNTSIFPLVAMILANILQISVLLYHLKQLKNTQDRVISIVFYTAMMVLSLSLMKFLQLFQTNALQYVPLLFPAAFVPLVLTVFMNRRTGLLSALFQVVMAIFVFYDSIGTSALTIVLISYLFSGLMGTMVKRKRIAEQGGSAVVWVVLFPMFMNLSLIIYQGLNFSSNQTWLNLIVSVAGSILSLTLTTALHPYIDLLLTDDSMIVLNELSNPNHPLLKKLLEEAPGTYNHSMMVANLSANAVAEINGASLITRVACYYHDIGKLKHANFFVENLPQGAENPHNFLLPNDSKQIIFGHVLDGAKILEENKMPQMVVDICRQHHGTTLMKYFYVKAKERNPNVSEEEFRYPGPIPQTKEAAVVSIADSCEAAVRAMDHPTNEKIETFVANLIKDRLLDGQLDDSGLTMKEIKIIQKSLVNGLCSTFHSRIKYPKMKSEAEKMKEEQERASHHGD